MCMTTCIMLPMHHEYTQLFHHIIVWQCCADVIQWCTETVQHNFPTNCTHVVCWKLSARRSWLLLTHQFCTFKGDVNPLIWDCFKFCHNCQRTRQIAQTCHSKVDPIHLHDKCVHGGAQANFVAKYVAVHTRSLADSMVEMCGMCGMAVASLRTTSISRFMLLKVICLDKANEHVGLCVQLLYSTHSTPEPCASYKARECKKLMPLDYWNVVKWRQYLHSQHAWKALTAVSFCRSMTCSKSPRETNSRNPSLVLRAPCTGQRYNMLAQQTSTKHTHLAQVNSIWPKMNSLYLKLYAVAEHSVDGAA